MLQPLPGHVATGIIIAAVVGHEILAVLRDPEQLITRVIARWRQRNRLLVDAVIVYFAGHLLDLWPLDPLTVRDCSLGRQ